MARMASTEPAPRLRVVSMNLWGIRGEWEHRRAVLRSGLAALQPDLVTFQEVIETDRYDQARDLLGPEYHLAQQRHREPDGQGICIASRWPMTDLLELDLDVPPRTADFACAALLARIESPEPFGPCLLVNHLPSWQLDFESEREQQAVRTARAIADRAADGVRHVVLAGDFDADPDAASVRFWSGRQSLEGMSTCYRDAWDAVHPGEPGHTFTPENPVVADPDWPFRRIDYIFVRCGEHGGPTLAVTGCERIFAEPVDGIWASDHVGLCADLQIPPART